ncbi:MAG: polysaccharide deacetylase family protein [Treponema sp.]|jgi:peptidoglycan/xylan/chitin deacetylase (PgdA/CDA1 family)|nr:polysaccharide deacetylase family protein [Treponema sp.]
MKNTFSPFCFFLLPLVFLAACASRPRVAERARIETPPQVIAEQILRRVQQNGSDIEKHFTLSDDGRITVGASLRDATNDYDVAYDLENASALGDSAYAVRFVVQARKSGAKLEDSLVWRPRTGKAGLLLSFDDDYADSWERQFGLFDQYGARVTFFVTGTLSPFPAKAISRGHDVGYHSLGHLDLRQLPRTAFASQTTEPLASFRRAGVPLSSFAFPFGFSEPWMHEALSPSFAVLRGYGATFRLYRESEIRSGYIVSCSIDNTIIPGEDHFDRDITMMLRTVKFIDGDWVLPLTTHDISTAAWGISRRRLEFLLKTAAELGLVFYRYSDSAAPR